MPILDYLDLLFIVTYLLVTALAGGVASGMRIRSPVLAAVVGGLAAVVLLYGSVFLLMFLVVLIFQNLDDLSSIDWWFLAALLTYPATPAFLIGLVTAAVTSFFRTSSGSKRQMMAALRDGNPTPAFMDALADPPERADEQ
jgi:hypothetical protein